MRGWSPGSSSANGVLVSRGTHPTHVWPTEDNIRYTPPYDICVPLVQLWYFLVSFYSFFFSFSLFSFYVYHRGPDNIICYSARLGVVSSLEDFFPGRRKNPKINWFCLYYSSLCEKKKHTHAYTHTHAHTLLGVTSQTSKYCFLPRVSLLLLP